jgi:hypothetical protein
MTPPGQRPLYLCPRRLSFVFCSGDPWYRAARHYITRWFPDDAFANSALLQGTYDGSLRLFSVMINAHGKPSDRLGSTVATAGVRPPGDFHACRRLPLPRRAHAMSTRGSNRPFHSSTTRTCKTRTLARLLFFPRSPRFGIHGADTRRQPSGPCYAASATLRARRGPRTSQQGARGSKRSSACARKTQPVAGHGSTCSLRAPKRIRGTGCERGR